MNKIKLLGIELEMEFNYDEKSDISEYKRSYHGGKFDELISGWKIEGDSSIEKYEFDESGTAEIISKATDKEQFFKNLQNLIKYFKSDEDGDEYYELKDVINFNSSCGAHIHVTFENEKLHKVILLEHQNLLKKQFIKELKKSKLPTRVQNSMISNYHRGGYCRMYKDIYSLLHERGSINLNSAYNGKGIEWRSFNVVGVETFEQLVEAINVGIRTLENFDYENIKIKDVEQSREHEIKDDVIVFESQFMNKNSFCGEWSFKDSVNHKGNILVNNVNKERILTKSRKSSGTNYYSAYGTDNDEEGY